MVYINIALVLLSYYKGAKIRKTVATLKRTIEGHSSCDPTMSRGNCFLNLISPYFFTAVKFGSFPTLVSVEHDAAVGKSMCSVGHAIKRKIDYFSKCVHLMDYSVLMFM